MPLGPQPRRARGTIEHPDSALNLRLWLAAYGLLTCVFMAVLLGLLGLVVPAVLVAALGVAAAVDLVVIQLRRRAARQERLDRRQHP